jgi:hypothetical protein
LSAAGTSFATAALAPEDDDAGVEADVEVDDDDAAVELADELLLLLLPHAAIATTHGSSKAASSDFLQETIRLLLVRPQ